MTLDPKLLVLPTEAKSLVKNVSNIFDSQLILLGCQFGKASGFQHLSEDVVSQHCSDYSQHEEEISDQRCQDPMGINLRYVRTSRIALASDVSFLLLMTLTHKRVEFLARNKKNKKTESIKLKSSHQEVVQDILRAIKVIWFLEH